eukprot:s1768_g16.t1
MLLWISEVESAAVGNFRVEMRRLYQVLWCCNSSSPASRQGGRMSKKGSSQYWQPKNLLSHENSSHKPIPSPEHMKPKLANSVFTIGRLLTLCDQGGPCRPCQISSRCQ